MKLSLTAKLLKISLYTIFVGGVILLATLPFMLERYTSFLFRLDSLNPDYRGFIIPFLTVIGIIALWIVAELIGTVSTISSDPFVSQNVFALRRMGIAGLIAALLFFAKCFYYITPLTLACGFLLLICSMGAFTLSDLFRRAVAYKEENELTI